MAAMVENNLKNIWTSLLDVPVISTCNLKDVELQSVAMLLGKTFSLFEKLKARCEEAESSRQEPCSRCHSLEKVISTLEEKLKHNEARMKSIAQILNLGGLTEESDLSPQRQQSMAKALTQILMDEEDGEPDTKGVKRKRDSASMKKEPLPKPTETQSRTQDLVVVPETLPVVQSQSIDSCARKNIVLETMCSQTAVEEEANGSSDNLETYCEPELTPAQHAPQSWGRTSPIIRRRKERKHKLSQVQHGNVTSAESVDREEALSQDTSTSSPTIAGFKKSPFTPKLRLTKPRDFVSTATSTPNMLHETYGSSSLPGDEMPGFRSSSDLHDVVSELDSNGAKDVVREKNKQYSGESVGQVTSFTEIKSTGSAELDNILDIMCDTGVEKRATTVEAKSRPVSTQESVKRQADYWKLKPASCSKESISLKNGAKLVQTKIAFGVHPEKTDICMEREFNGGIRLSDSPITPNILALKDFNSGIRPSLTSTMLPVDYLQDSTKEAAIGKDILNSFLDDASTQLEDDDFISASPELSLNKRTLYSQKHKSSRKCAFRPSHQECDENADVKEIRSALASTDGGEQASQYNLSRKTANLIRDFDKVPKRQADEPGYKYQRNAVRKREERKKLSGWDCAECERYYAGIANTSTERKQLMDKCSRHRNKYQRNASPPGFWDPAFPSTPELKARNLDVTQKPLKLRVRKKRVKTTPT